MANGTKTQYTASVAHETAAVVQDVHLGQVAPAVTAAFHRFLQGVPDVADHLVVNGDLFDFWFEYRSVIPRRAFPTLSALERLRAAGVRLTMVGGNHDRWGGAFWREELGADVLPAGGPVRLAGWRAWCAHGDGLAERRVAARLMHRVTRWRATASVFRRFHPDFGMWLVHRLSGALADQTRDPGELARVAGAQAVYARRYLADHPEVDLVVLGHTHRPALEAVGAGRWYVNGGAFLEGGCYALVDAAGPRLCTDGMR